MEKLEKEVKDKTAEVSNNDISLEKKANELKEKILSYNTNDKLEDLEQQVIQTKKENNIIDNQKDDEITDNDKLNKYSFFSPISEEKVNVDKEKNNPDTKELVKENFKKNVIFWKIFILQ